MNGEEKGKYVDMANDVESVPPEDALVNYEETDDEIMQCANIDESEG